MSEETGGGKIQAKWSDDIHFMLASLATYVVVRVPFEPTPSNAAVIGCPQRAHGDCRSLRTDQVTLYAYYPAAEPSITFHQPPLHCDSLILPGQHMHNKNGSQQSSGVA